MLQCSMILKLMVSTSCMMSNPITQEINFLYQIKLESILSVLNDPSFERSQPSWVRRLPHSASHSTTLLPSVVMPGSSGKPPPCLSPLLNTEEVDYSSKEEIEIEFEDEEKGERALLTMVCTEVIIKHRVFLCYWYNVTDYIFPLCSLSI